MVILIIVAMLIVAITLPAKLTASHMVLRLISHNNNLLSQCTMVAHQLLEDMEVWALNSPSNLMLVVLNLMLALQLSLCKEWFLVNL
jgi:hypothetical protein